MYQEKSFVNFLFKHMKKLIFFSFFLTILSCTTSNNSPIDRETLVYRNSPHITAFDSLASFTVGNGEFAYTVDATGLQTFPAKYTKGVPLGTQSQWGWHSFENPNNFQHSETLKNYNFRGKEEPYSVQFNEDGRQKDAANWYRVNPHRLHLGIIGFDLSQEDDFARITDVDQMLELWQGVVKSNFKLGGEPVSVQTACDPKEDAIAVVIESKKIPAIKFHFPYPTGGHADDACDWTKNDLHSTELINSGDGFALLKRTLDASVYYVNIRWKGEAAIVEKSKNYFLLEAKSDKLSFSAEFTLELPSTPSNLAADAIVKDSKQYWKDFWTKGAAVDFSECKDERAAELERRVVLSQYLLAIQSSGSTPPQETGLTYNSWYGKFHLEMIWWHQSHFALWNRPELLERTLGWYHQAMPMAREIAQRQGFEGVRWMKMTDPSATEAPSKVGSFLIWQQPHLIYLAELVYRANPSQEFLDEFAPLIEETARFMYSFADYDMLDGRYILQGAIPAQETLRASETINPPFEVSYWHFAMNLAQKWRERTGKERNLEWDEMIDKLSPLAYQEDGLYLAAETALDTYKDIRYTSDHMAVLGAMGIVPHNQLIRKDYMQNTLNWVWDNWNWGKTWGWDYPMTAMNAARLGDPEKAVGALLMDRRTNTYLPNGHNYQDSRLRVYLPGNGGLLTAIAMMCAGWDGCEVETPGFPKDGNWNVKWEGLLPMP